MSLNCNVKEVRSIYKTLKKEGVTDAQLAPKGQKPACEDVVDYVFDNYQDYPGIIKELSGYEPTWVLTDNAVLQKARDARAMITSILESTGIKQGTIEYKKALAIGSFYFVYAPTKEDIAEGAKDTYLWTNLQAELLLEGLDKFSKWLGENGGLGLGLIKSDAPFEAPADDVIKSHLGACTERSKVIYAIFKDAGLDPSFAMISAEDVDKAWNDHWHGKVPRAEAITMLQNTGHIVVGIDLGGKNRYFDAMIRNAYNPSNAPFDGVAGRIGLREFRILENSNKLGDDTKETKGNNTNGLYEKTLLLGSTASLAECWIYTQQLEMLESFDGGINEMTGVYEAGKATCSGLPLFLTSAANAMINHDEMGDTVKGLLEEALKIAPDNVLAHHLMATYWLKHGDRVEARKWVEKTYELDRTLTSVLNNIGAFYIEEKGYAQAEGWLKKGLEAYPLDTGLTNNLALALMSQDRSAEAVKLFLQSIAMLDSGVDNYDSLAMLYSKQKLEGQANLLKEMSYLYEHKEDKKAALLIHYGDFLVEQKRPDLAIDLYESFVTVKPDGDVYIKLIRLYRAAGRFKDEALKFRLLSAVFDKQKFFDVGFGWLVALWNAKEPLDPAIDYLSEMSQGKVNPELDMSDMIEQLNEYSYGLPAELAAREEVKKPISQIYIRIAEAAREKGEFNIVNNACDRAILTSPPADAILNTMRCQSLRLPASRLEGTQ